MSRNTSVTLGDHFDQYVSAAIEGGRYQSVSEVVRAGLRKLEESDRKLELLRNKLEAAERSPIVKDFDSNNFKEQMRAKYSK